MLVHARSADYHTLWTLLQIQGHVLVRAMKPALVKCKERSFKQMKEVFQLGLNSLDSNCLGKKRASHQAGVGLLLPLDLLSLCLRIQRSHLLFTGFLY